MLCKLSITPLPGKAMRRRQPSCQLGSQLALKPEQNERVKLLLVGTNRAVLRVPDDPTWQLAVGPCPLAFFLPMPIPAILPNCRRSGERIAFGYLISQKFVSERASVEVLRGGKSMQLDISLAAPQPLVPLHLAGADPSFLVVTGNETKKPYVGAK